MSATPRQIARRSNSQRVDDTELPKQSKSRNQLKQANQKMRKCQDEATILHNLLTAQLIITKVVTRSRAPAKPLTYCLTADDQLWICKADIENLLADKPRYAIKYSVESQFEIKRAMARSDPTSVTLWKDYEAAYAKFIAAQVQVFKLENSNKLAQT